MARGDVVIRQVETLEDAHAVAAVIAELWGPSLAPPELLRALASHGNPIFAAHVGGNLVGAQMSFLSSNT